MKILIEYSLLLLKVSIYVLAFLGTVTGVLNIINRSKKLNAKKLIINVLNEHYASLARMLSQKILDKKSFKRYQKTQAYELKTLPTKKRLFVLDFQGDIKASAVESLREIITTVLKIATLEDEVLIRLESAGGYVPHYGLAAAQLERLKTQHIPLTISVDKCAASGGYLMACVADKILACPFSVIGSIGVLAQFPNFNRLLKQYNIDYELITAGEHKRTMTVFGENTTLSREKMQEQVQTVHNHFKNFIARYRPQVDLQKIGNGDHWLGEQALSLQLIDQLVTSDEYILQKSSDRYVYHIDYVTKKHSLKDKIMNYLGVTF